LSDASDLNRDWTALGRKGRGRNAEQMSNNVICDKWIVGIDCGTLGTSAVFDGCSGLESHLRPVSTSRVDSASGNRALAAGHDCLLK